MTVTGDITSTDGDGVYSNGDSNVTVTGYNCQESTEVLNLADLAELVKK